MYNNRLYQKFNQISNEHNEHKHSEEKNNDKMYSFGCHFYYGYPYETHLSVDTSVSSKYSSLKKELTANKISKMNMEQFQNEYKKATIHYEANHCKEMEDWNDMVMPLECILSLMIYCNYDCLQSELSKTYRESKVNKHNQFYWMGRFLKMSIIQFGTYIHRGNIVQFYHGMSERLFFPDYTTKVHILCPLSTSTSFAVAINFTNHHNGLVVDLRGDVVDLSGAIFTPKYFSVSWLSDYGNEFERLFIQNDHSFIVYNIIDPDSGFEYKHILMALQNIDVLIHSYIDADVRFAGEKKYAKGNKLNITNSIEALMELIISDRLSTFASKYKPFTTLDTFSRSICNKYFENSDKCEIGMDYTYIEKSSPLVFGLLFDEKLGWIKIPELLALFPVLYHIKIKNVNVSPEIMEDILNKSQILNVRTNENYEKQITKPWAIWITPKINELTLDQIVRKYSNRFHEINVILSANMYHNQLNIEKRCQDFDAENNKDLDGEMIAILIKNLGQRYFFDKNNKYSVKTDECIKWALSKKSSPFTDKRYVSIDWRDIVANPELGGFKQFYHSKYEWVRIDTLNRFHPNMIDLTIRGIRLSCLTFDDILNHLTNFKTKLLAIVIGLGAGKTKTFEHRKGYPDDSEVLEVCKELTGYTKDDNIFEHDWGGFDKLYDIRDIVEKTKNGENVYHVDSLIVEYSMLKYKQKFEMIGFEMCAYGSLDEVKIEKI
eukprot:523247_1